MGTDALIQCRDLISEGNSKNMTRLLPLWTGFTDYAIDFHSPYTLLHLCSCCQLANTEQGHLLKPCPLTHPTQMLCATRAQTTTAMCPCREQNRSSNLCKVAFKIARLHWARGPYKNKNPHILFIPLPRQSHFSRPECVRFPHVW